MNERRMHAVFGFLFIASVFASDQLDRYVPAWKDPKVGLLSLLIALVWLVSFFVARGTALLDEIKILRDRVERLENKVRWLEDEQP